jgi:hypothetical protein
METMVETGAPASFRSEAADRVGSATRTPGWDVGIERRVDDGEAMAGGMGWFSLGLGALELVAGDRVAEWLGMEEHATLIRLYGVREIATGVGVLTNRRPVGWIRGRIAGDVLDLATLAAGLRGDNPHRRNVMLAMGAVLGATALDLLSERQLSRTLREAASLRAEIH